MLEPIQIEVADQADARALATALTAVASVRVEAAGRTAGVAVYGAATSELLVCVLRVVQQVLEQRPPAQALVRLDGREYRMDGS